MDMEFTEIMHRIGIESENTIQLFHILWYLFASTLVGCVFYLVARKWLAKLVMHLAGKTATHWDDLMFDQRFFNRLGFLLAFIVIKTGLSALVWNYKYIIDRLLDTTITFAFIWLAAAILDGGNRIYESYPVSRNRPIKVFIQLVKIFLYCAGVLITIHIFTGQSVSVLLGGLTAFAAVLMLIFRDSILGFVAGIQLTANDMVRIGDWIVMPSSNADGDVLEINLTTVKVQNWDKTITTIPTYKLVAESFTNWRGMHESKGRRIKRSVNIDVNSIHYLSDEELEKLKESAFLKSYIEQKMEELKAFNSSRVNPLDVRRLTNIGTFREYLEAWIAHHPDINKDLVHMVRQLQPGPTGLPLEIYCFSARQKWVDYEKVQSDVFDHIFAVMELFNLKTFQFTGHPIAEQ